MNTREQILASPETLSDFAWASEQRFRDADTLLSKGRFSGSIYLGGLAAEMWLKLACAKYVRLSPTASATALLAPAKIWMKFEAPTILPESYHSLLFWAEYLTRRRISDGRSMSGRLAGELRHHVVNRLFTDWKIDVRYRTLPLDERCARRVYNDVTWIRSNWDQLWR